MREKEYGVLGFFLELFWKNVRKYESLEKMKGKRKREGAATNRLGIEKE